jgi:hypothetical protein
MLNISINLETGLAKLAVSSPIKAGGAVPVRVTFSANPGSSPTIELALSAQSSSPSVLAYLDTFDAQSSTVYTGTLDANDTRLIAAIAGKSTLTLDAEVVLTVGEAERQVFPNFSVTVQPPIITGPESTQGGGVYLSGAMRISTSGLEIKDTETNVWRLITFVNGELSYTEL